MSETIGPYQVLREVGRGGMGVVYLARDSRLDRDVAIKALPEDLAQDPVRLARFEREAKTMASLNHPNVAGIHGVEEQDGAQYLVLEFVDGESLADRLDRGPLPVDEAIELALQIAAGIEAAHEAGVIHRDLKPANIMITPEGVAKVLDFGLARTDEGQSSTGVALDAPTMPQNSPTIAGAILGTAAYMSPEQARGRRVDRRSDTWAFGVILYEMLSGTSPFQGETATDSIGAVLHKDVDLGRLPPETPASVRRVLGRCLVRDKSQRYRDIGDLRLELLHADDDPTEEQGIAKRHIASQLGAPMLLVLAIGLAAAAWFLKPEAPASLTPQMRLAIPLPDGLEIAGPIAIAPNGETIAFTAFDELGVHRLYTRRLDSYEITEVEGSVGAAAPFFSPDSTSVGFASRRNLFRSQLAGGRPVRIINTTESFSGACWLEDDTIIYSEQLGSALKRVGADGRQYDDVSEIVPGDGFYAHVWPQIIPGTGKVLFTGWSDSSTTGEGGGRILDMETGKHRRVAFTNAGFGMPSRWIESGHLLFEAFGAGELRAIAMNPKANEPVSQASAMTILTGVAGLSQMTRSIFDVSAGGTLAYVPIESDGNRLVWVDSQGTTEPVLDQSDIDYFLLDRKVLISPDGTSVLLGGGGEISVLDLSTGLCRQITDSDGNKFAEGWAPDGSRVYFTSNKDKRWSIWAVGLEANAKEEMIFQSEGDVFNVGIAEDGTIVTSARLDGQYDLLVVRPDGTERWLTQTPESEDRPVLSPDGRWVAFARQVTGIGEVFVVDISGESPPVQISRGGGSDPKWSIDGTALAFRRGRGVARVSFADGRSVGEAIAVFDAPRLNLGSGYDFSADGSRMLAIQQDEGAVLDEIRVITRIFDEVRRVAGPGSRQEVSP